MVIHITGSRRIWKSEKTIQSGIAIWIFHINRLQKQWKQDCRVKLHIHLYIAGHKAATVARIFVEQQNKLYHKLKSRRPRDLDGGTKIE